MSSQAHFNPYPLIYRDARPKILLLGNGINQSFSKTSWKSMLDSLKTHFGTGHIEAEEMPFPLQAILLTENKLAEGVKVVAENVIRFDISPEQKDLFERIFDLGFDAILTTNYSYELEEALDSKFHPESLPHKNMMHTPFVQNPEKTYAMHTYYRFEHQGRYQNLWHIHGEARKPKSIVLGHDYYGRLLGKYREYLYKQTYFRNDTLEHGVEVDSWIDLFMLGDVHVLGFGFDYSEIDLWWLLSAKAGLKNAGGRTIFYGRPPEAHEEDENKCMVRNLANKHRLLAVLGTEVHCDGPSKYIEMYNHYIDEMKEE